MHLQSTALPVKSEPHVFHEGHMLPKVRAPS